MSSALRRIAATGCLFPDPQGLVQEVREKDATFQVPILKERVFPHYVRTALVTQRVNDLERKYRRKVEKRGKDPHHAFALMLCDVALSRAYGVAQFLIPDMSESDFPTSPEHHPVLQKLMYRQAYGDCGQFRIKDGEPGAHGYGACKLRSSPGSEMGVQDKDPGCPAYAPR